MKKEFVFRLVLALGIFFLVYQFAVKPMIGDVQLTGDKNGDNGLKIFAGSEGGYDLVVMGEQPDGIAAAVAAARLGAKTLLLSQGENLGGAVSRCLLTDLEIPYGEDNKILNAGFLSELDYRLGQQFSPQDYISSVNTLVKNEKNLDVKYNVMLDSPVITGHKLEALTIRSNNVKSTVEGRMFIDATQNGDLLLACKIPYTTGSEDLNLKESFMPLKLNFQMEGADISRVRELLKNMDAVFYKTLAEYEPADVDSWVGNFRINVINDNTIIVQGLEFANVNAIDPRELKNAYSTAVKEAKSFALFLADRIPQLHGWKYQKAAEELYVGEGRHFKGLYELSVNEVLDNAYFDKTAAMGSYPVQIGKFAGKGVYIAGKPVQYGIPVGCLIPAEIDNMLMTGGKISCSSLAASSTGTMGTEIATGNSAGVISAYCLLNNLDPADIEREKDEIEIEEFGKFMKKQGLYFPDTDIKNKNASNWAYPALEELITLGLVAGGMDNNYSFDKKATQGDLAILLLNGIYRLDRASYSLALDARIRPYFNREELTRDRAAKILEGLI